MNDSLATGDCDEAYPSTADVSPAELRSRILIIEDEALVAQSLADLVTDAGFLALELVATAAEAVRVLDQRRPHAAILDIVLRDGMATRVAIELASRGIPFIVYSGLPSGGVSLPELARARWHEKPGSGDELISVLAELIGEDVRLRPRTLELRG
jgi:DNA-binding response OmpR family regulator